MNLSDYQELFTDCTTIADANDLYQVGFNEYQMDWDLWSEAHRRCMRALTDARDRATKIESAPIMAEAGVSAAKIRDWAHVQGVVVGKRGRINPAVIAQYQAATG
jgi:hypothetical protein